jgi:hypothetical protein
MHTFLVELIHPSHTWCYNHSVDYSGKECVKHIQSLLNIPLSVYNNVLVLLKLDNYTSIIPHLGYANR